MDSVDNTCDPKREMDDSGCVHDDSSPYAISQPSLLDFSDDVLLCIFRYCPAPDLKALAHSCLRLARLVRERSLWRNVDASLVPCSRARLRWYLDNVLHSDTRSLKLNGYARDAKGCVGLINIPRKESLEPKNNCFQAVDGISNEVTICGGFQEIPTEIIEREPPQGDRQNARYFISAQRPQLPRHRCCMSWPDDNLGRPGPHSCSGPQFSISPELFQQLSARCLHLTTLCLDYCNIDCHSTGLAVFPKSLKKLSLRGSKCYNVTFDKSFVYKIQDHLPQLLSLDISECEWMEPAGLLPLSKMAALEELIMQDCYKMSEFVAYASLTARYGFKTLKSLDLRGSPVGDSEVSALGWLPELEKLWLSARGVQRARPHAHYADDERSEHVQLDPWEVTGLEYTPISSPDTCTENIGNGADVSPDGSSPSNEKDNANNDEHKKGTKRKSTDKSDSKANGEPSRKRRKDDKQNKAAYKAIGVISINGLRRALGFDNQQNRNIEERRREVGIAIEAIPELNAIHVNAPNKKVCINVRPSENGNDGKVNTENDEKPLNNEENADKVKDKHANDKGDERNDPSNSRQQPEAPLVHPSAECVIDCIKIDQMHDAKAKRGRSNEVLVIASGSRKHRLPRNFPDYDRVHIKRNRDPVVVEIRPQRMYDNQNRDNENRPGPSNEGEDNPDYISFTNEPNSRENPINFQELLLEPEELQRRLRKQQMLREQMQQQQMEQSPEPVKMDEEKQKEEHAQNSEQVQVEAKEEKPEQAQSENQMDTSEHVEGQEQVPKPELEQKLERTQQPERWLEQELMQIEKQEQRPEPTQLEEQKQTEELKQKPEQMIEQMQKSEEQEQKPEKTDEQKEKTEQMKEQMQEENPEKTDGQKQKPELKQNTESLEKQKQKLEKREKKKQRAKQRQEQKPDKIEEQKHKPEQEQKPEKVDEQKRNPEQMAVPDMIQGLEQGQRPEQGNGAAPRPLPIQYQVGPRHHVLYVGVGPQLNTYRFPRDASELIRHVNYGPTHVDSRLLVTDFALRRFGRAEGDVNIIHLDPNGPVPVGQSSGSRPDRSNLRLLSVNGYRNVTDRSLVHLATAAPHLEYVDFTGTSISANGVRVFKGLNPDCTFVHSPFEKKE